MSSSEQITSVSAWGSHELLVAKENSRSATTFVSSFKKRRTMEMFSTPVESRVPSTFKVNPESPTSCTIASLTILLITSTSSFWISWLAYVAFLGTVLTISVNWGSFLMKKFSSDRKSPLPPSFMLENASTVPLNANWWVARNSITSIRGEIQYLFISIAFELSNVEISSLFVDRFSFYFHMTQHAKWSFEWACLGKPSWASVACFQSRYPFSVKAWSTRLPWDWNKHRLLNLRQVQQYAASTFTEYSNQSHFSYQAERKYLFVFPNKVAGYLWSLTCLGRSSPRSSGATTVWLLSTRSRTEVFCNCNSSWLDDNGCESVT